MLSALNNKTQHIPEDAINLFASGLAGRLIRPRDIDYDEARAVWNGMIDRHPTFIVQCRSAADVALAVLFARQHGLKTAVRGGGHNVAGLAVWDDALVIDLRLMNDVEVDATNQIAYAAGGATIADLDAATQTHGLVTPMGVVSATGIAGLTLGGGFGWLRNKFGLACDNLIMAEVVTANGDIIRASEEENSDLLWGLRGGGGNFGIVTQFAYQLYPLGPEVAFTFCLHNGEGEKMKKAIQFYRDFSASAPGSISTIMASGIVPPIDHFPKAIHNKPFVLIGGMFAGDPQEGWEATKPLREFAEPLIDFSGIMPYVEAQQMFDDDYPDGARYYWKSLNLTELGDDAIDRIVYHAQRQPSILSTVDLWHVGGMVKQVGADEAAFHGRHASFLLSPEANWEKPEDDEANIAWLRSFIADMEQFSDGSRYLNFPGFQEEGDEMMEASFGPQYEKLAALKAKYDPTNFFSVNQNIKPKDVS